MMNGQSMDDNMCTTTSYRVFLQLTRLYTNHGALKALSFALFDIWKKHVYIYSDMLINSMQNIFFSNTNGQKLIPPFCFLLTFRFKGSSSSVLIVTQNLFLTTRMCACVCDNKLLN